MWGSVTLSISELKRTQRIWYYKDHGLFDWISQKRASLFQHAKWCKKWVKRTRDWWKIDWSACAEELDLLKHPEIYNVFKPLIARGPRGFVEAEASTQKPCLTLLRATLFTEEERQIYRGKTVVRDMKVHFDLLFASTRNFKGRRLTLVTPCLVKVTES